MINIITHTDSKNIINDFDSFFDLFVLSQNFKELDKEVLFKIDNAILIDKNDIKTPFGTTNILNLSTGCKTVLSYLHMIRNKAEYQVTAGCTPFTQQGNATATVTMTDSDV